MRGRPWGALVFVLSVAPALDAQQPAVPAAAAAEPSIYDRIWGLADLYANEANPVLQSLTFVGRFQLDYATVSADEGDADEWNVRRMRLGLRAGVHRRFILHTEMDLNPQERDPTYLRLTDAFLRWSPTDSHEVTIGKQGVSFTLDGTTSSKELLTLDRSNVSGNLWFSQEYMPGITVAGGSAPMEWEVGLFSAGEANREFGEFSGTLFGTLAVVHDLSERMGVPEATFGAQYVLQPEDTNNTFTRALEHVLSLNGRYDRGGWGARADLSVAKGQQGQSDLWGIVAMPYLNVTDRLQVVARYSVLSSADPNGVVLPTYENRAASGRGDRYQDFYAGLNYYLYGHALKLQSGIQAAEMTDEAADGGAYSGISWTTGIRIGW